MAKGYSISASTTAARAKSGFGSFKRMVYLILLASYMTASVIYSSIKLMQRFGPSRMVTENEVDIRVIKKQNSYSNTNRYIADNKDETEEPPYSRNCLDLGFDNEMDRLLSKYKQVYIIMPAKAAGTTAKAFSKSCMDSTNTPSFQFYDNIANKQEAMKKALTNQLEMPTLVTSHVYDSRFISKLMEHATRDSLVIYIHREETSRLLSSIREIISSRYCFNTREQDQYEDIKIPGVVTIGDHCQVQEETLIELIETKEGEIGFSGPRLLTCQAYESVRENRPNMVFVGYKQVNKLLKLLSKHHCPNVSSDVRENVGGEKQHVSIVLGGPKNKGDMVDLDDWLQAKKQLVEYALNMKENIAEGDDETNISCQSTIREIEDRLFACPSETLQVSGQSYGTRSIPFLF